MRWWRRVRAGGVLAVGWSVVWALAGAGLTYLRALLSPEFAIVRDSGSVLEWMARDAVRFGTFGFVAGLGFAGLLLMLERRRSTETLSPGRTVLWGVVATLGWASLLVLGVVFKGGRHLGGVPGAFLQLGAVGALCAYGTLRLARRPAATRRAPEQPSAEQAG